MRHAGRIRWLPAAITLSVTAALFGCSLSRQEAGVDRKEVNTFMESFMKDVLADDWERAFAAIDIGSLVNYGRSQGEFYRTLPEKMKARYRRDFIQGIYAYLYRDTPRGEARPPRIHLSADPLTVEVRGSREGKWLHFHLVRHPEDFRIVRVEKAEGPPSQAGPAP